MARLAGIAVVDPYVTPHSHFPGLRSTLKVFQKSYTKPEVKSEANGVIEELRTRQSHPGNAEKVESARPSPTLTQKSDPKYSHHPPPTSNTPSIIQITTWGKFSMLSGEASTTVFF
jgi:hypothetical protein